MANQQNAVVCKTTIGECNSHWRLTMIKHTLRKLASFRLNSLQLIELAKVFLDLGKAMFLASVAAYFIPSLTDQEIPTSTLVNGLIGSLTSIAIGVILLSKGDKR